MVWSSVNSAHAARLRWRSAILLSLLFVGPALAQVKFGGKGRRPVTGSPFIPSARLAPGRGGSKFRPRGRSKTLTTARFSTVRDSKGFSWTISSDGSVRSTSVSWFRSAQFLMVNGTSFSSSTRQMTSGQQYVLTGSANGYGIRRLVQLVGSEGYVRYIDSVTNPYSQRRKVNVQFVTTMRYPPRAVLSHDGKPYLASKKQRSTGSVILQSRSSYPAIIQYWGRGSKASLNVQRLSTSNLQYRWSFQINLAPKQTWTLAHGIALRNTASGRNLTSSEMKTLYQPFEAKTFLSGIPVQIRRTLVNTGGGFIELSPSAGQLLRAVDQFAARWQLDRKSDTLVVDDETQLKGKVTATKLQVTTRFGSAEIALADIAMIQGGNGSGGVQRVHLRTGEILVGDMQLPGATMQTDAGIPVKLSVDRLHTLVFSRKSNDGKASKEMAMLVQTQSGNRFAIREKPAFSLNAATAWGRVTVPMSDVVELRMQRSPYPMQIIQFRDGSRLKALLAGSQVKVGTLRFGEIGLVPITVSSLTRLSATQSKAILVPHFRLVGENVLVGSFVDKALRLRTSNGIVVVKTSEIQRVQQNGGTLQVTKKNGERVTGTLLDDVFSIKSLGKTWQLPARHLLTFTFPRKPADGAKAGSKTANSRPTLQRATTESERAVTEASADTTPTPPRRKR